jgi:hypothetical protein
MHPATCNLYSFSHFPLNFCLLPLNLCLTPEQSGSKLATKLERTLLTTAVLIATKKTVNKKMEKTLKI